MAPRTGIRGVTINDVANVANQGSSVMRGGYTFTRGNRPMASSFTVPKVEDLISGMTAGRLNTAGQRYSGYPTASAQEAAVLGSIEPFYEMGALASQMAQQQMGDLVGERARIADTLGIQSANELAAAQAQLDAERAKAAFAPGQIPPNLAQAEADRDLAAYGAAMAARNRVAFARPTAVVDPMTGNMIASLPTSLNRALEQTAITSAENQPEFRQQIAPMAEFGAQVAEVPRYELARQMATQYFGMDPALAAGTFTPQIDIDYMTMQRDLAEQQQLAMGINPEASVEDTLLQLDPSGERLFAYQQQLALEAEKKLMEGQNNAVEDAWDQDIEVAYGFPVDVAAGDYSRSTTRDVLNDENFIASVQSALTAMQEIDPNQIMSNEDRKRAVDGLAARYLQENPDNPVAARILLNILYYFTFTVPTATNPLG